MLHPAMTAGITKAGEGEGGVIWNILGQTYRPLQWTAESFAFHSLFPPGTFVPPHIHPDQDEFIYVLGGSLELFLEGQTRFAAIGDLVRLPRGVPHGIFNKSEAKAETLGWVTPSGQLYELFSHIHDVADPNEVVRIATAHGVAFLPPPA